MVGQANERASEMTPQQAQATIRQYQQLLAADDSRGARRDPALLPTTKANVMRAIKMEIAQLYYIGSATDEQVQPLIRSAMFLDSFTREPVDTVAFVEAMQRRRAELEEFQHQLMGIGREAAYYWQRVYAMIGVGAGAKSETLFDTFKRKMGLSARETSTTKTTTTRQMSGRIELD
jgi:hypothetical protein